jgi:peptidase M50B-like protein
MTVRTPFSTELARIGQVQAHLPGAVAAVVGVVALGAAVLPDIWFLTRYFHAIVHEAAHATVASAVGRKVHHVNIKPNGDGLTDSSGADKTGFVLTGVAGYLGPSGFGLLAAKLIQIGHSVAVLWLAIVLLLCLLVVTRKFFGVFTVLVCGALLLLVAAGTSLGAQIVVAYAVAWFLLLSGLVVVRRHGTNAGDADILRGQTRVPKGVWSLLWHLGALAALVYGALLLV